MTRLDWTKLPVLEDLPDLKGARVLVRADLNVPLVKNPSAKAGESLWSVGDDFRIRSCVPTLFWLANNGAKITVCSHLGRPHGEPDPKWEMAPVAKRLAEIGPPVTVLENLRFNAGEEANDADFVKALIENQDYFVNDAFGVSHRSHASVVGPPQHLPSAAGRLLEREVQVLTSLLESPSKPFVAVVGGAKVSEKLGVLTSLSKVADKILVGGAMAFTFLRAMGLSIGDSLVEPDRVDECRKLLESCATVIVPTDTVCLSPGGKFGADGQGGETKIIEGDIPEHWRGLDIGPVTTKKYAQEVEMAQTVFWNGPMGVCEDSRFKEGTRGVAQAVAKCPGFTVVGGGDSAKAIGDLGLTGAADYVSTGGGASLELIECGDLPGLKALRDSVKSSD